MDFMRVSVVLFVAVQLLSPAYGADDPYSLYAGCEAMNGSGACVAYARRSGATIYSSHDGDASALVRLGFGDGILLVKPASDLSESVWLPTYTVIRRSTPPDEEVIGWVRRTDVVLNTDLARVTSCWPLKFVGMAGEGFENLPQAVFFTRNGLATGWDPAQEGVDPNFGVVRKMFEEYGVQRTYYGEGIFLVRHEVYANRSYGVVGVLDYEKHSVKVGSAVLKSGEGVRWFSHDELKGCNDIPMVEQVPPPTPRLFMPHSG